PYSRLIDNYFPDNSFAFSGEVARIMTHITAGRGPAIVSRTQRRRTRLIGEDWYGCFGLTEAQPRAVVHRRTRPRIHDADGCVRHVRNRVRRNGRSGAL